MSVQSHTFTVGEITCTVLLDAASVLGREGFLKRFPQPDEATYEAAFAAMGRSIDAADDSRNVLLAQIGGETVLVDTGQGGDLLASLGHAGIDPAEISQVVITHCHGDHVMGLMHADAPAFPNATYVMARAEMDYWQPKLHSDAARLRPLIAMMEEKGLRLIDMDETIMPGLTAVPLPGHTPGHIGLLIESGGEMFSHMADLLHSPVQFAHPEWSARFDLDTAVSVPTRRAALARAAADGMLALFYHLTFPGLGHVTRQGDAFAWEPVAGA